MNADRKDETYSDIDTAVKELKKRRASEILRYNSLYHVDIMDMSNYDLVVDTNGKTPMEVAEIIINNFENWLKR
jgi:cytidylate kinase